MSHDRASCELCRRWDAFETGYRWTKHDDFAAELGRLESEVEELTKQLAQKSRRLEHLTGMVSKGPPARFRMPSYPLPPDIEEARRHRDELTTTDEPTKPPHD